MPMLTVNGIVIPARLDSLRVSHEFVGYKGRNTKGHRILDRRREKWVIEFEVGPLPLDQVMLYREVMLGLGEFWGPGTTGQFGDKGAPLTTNGSIGAGANPLGPYSLNLTTSQFFTLPSRFYDQSLVASSSGAAVQGATLLGWRNDTSYRCFAWSWRALDSAVAVKREKLGALGASGAVQNYSGTETLSPSSGLLTVTEPGAGGPWRYSNLWLIPRYFPQAYADELLNGFASIYARMPALPRVWVQTDLLPTDQLKASPVLEQAGLACHGQVDSLDVTPVARNGVFAQTECRLSCSLIEV